MEKFIIEGGERLIGTFTVSGAKNAALPLMAASLLCEGENTLTNVPNLKDIDTFKELLAYMGCEISHDAGKRILKIDSANVRRFEAPYELVKTIRMEATNLDGVILDTARHLFRQHYDRRQGARPVNL